MLLLALSLLLGTVTPMHTRLVRSEPAANAVVAGSPRALRLWFEGGIETEFTHVSLTGASGARLALGAPARGDESGLLVVPIPLRLAAGRYTVSWETVGRDGHAIRGSFEFAVAGTDGSVPEGDTAVTVDSTAWGAGAAGRTVPGAPVAAANDQAGPGTQGPSGYSPATRPVRWVELSALVCSLGAVALLLGALRTGRGGAAHERFIADAVRRVTRLGIAAAAVLLVAAVVRFALESQALHGGSGGLTAEALARTASIGWGRAWIVSVAAVIVMLSALLRRRHHAGAVDGRAVAPGGDLLLGISALGAAVGPAMTGHAAGAATLMPLSVLADWLHVVGASAWVGGVAGLALAGAPAALAQPVGERAPAMAWLVGAFHALAVPAIALVVLSGILSAWLRVGGWRDLVTSNYGDLVLFKVYLVALTALLGAYHWLRVHPRLVATTADDTHVTRRLQWTLYLEVAASLVVVAITAALVTTPPPR